jgi:hypothetical protein
MQPPSGTAANVALAAGILAAGGAAGALASRAAVPSNPSAAVDPQTQATIAGGALGVLATGLGGLVVEEYSSKWARLGRYTALMGVGIITGVSVLGFGNAIRSFRQQLPGGTTPALPASTANSFTATLADSGRTLNLNVGDSVTVSLPESASGTAWQWGISNNIATFSGQTAAPSGGVEQDTFTATAPGQSQLVASRVDANGNVLQTFSLNLTVLAVS